MQRVVNSVKSWFLKQSFRVKLFLVVFIFALLFVFSNNATGVTKMKREQANPDRCFYTEYKTKEYNNIKVKLVNKINENEFKEVSKSELAFTEVTSTESDLNYGVSVKLTEKGYYVTYELCHLDSNYSVSKPELREEEYIKYVDISGGSSETYAVDYKSVIYTNSEGVKLSSLIKVGTYQLTAFYKEEGGSDWFIADSLRFSVK